VGKQEGQQDTALHTGASIRKSIETQATICCPALHAHIHPAQSTHNKDE
jgi:hypothetical protein